MKDEVKKEKKEVEKVFLSTQLLWKKSPWSQLYEGHKKTWKSILADAGGTGGWGLYLLGLIDRGIVRQLEKCSTLEVFSAYYLKVSRVESWWKEKHSSKEHCPLAKAMKLLVTSWSTRLWWNTGSDMHSFGSSKPEDFPSSFYLIRGS